MYILSRSASVEKYTDCRNMHELVTFKNPCFIVCFRLFYDFVCYDSEERPVVVAFITSFLGPRPHLDFSVPIRLGGKNIFFPNN